MEIYRVASIAEAQALAAAFLKDGSYDWFRGQAQNWPLCSTFMRRPESEHDEIRAKIARFEHWAQTTAGLEEIVSTPDSLYAVAQHYGMPTNFVDFTTEPAVAAYFASERAPDEAGAESCILCLNTADLFDIWKHMPGDYPVPECLRLDVPNLWRLVDADNLEEGICGVPAVPVRVRVR